MLGQERREMMTRIPVCYPHGHGHCNPIIRKVKGRSGLEDPDMVFPGRGLSRNVGRYQHDILVISFFLNTSKKGVPKVTRFCENSL